ncbi:MAG: DDE-type integrase/transposase/recombinase, partial [Pseudomonadota bacterium]
APCPFVGIVHGTSDHFDSDHSIAQQKLIDEQNNDPELHPLIRYLNRKVLPSDDQEASRLILESEFYAIIDGILHRIHVGRKSTLKNGELRLVVPTSMQQEMLEAFHDDRFSGHLGIAKTFSKLRERYFWLSMYRDVVAYCNQCFKCATRKNPPHRTQLPLQSLPVEGPFDRIAVDYLGPLPQTEQGNKYLLVFSDYLTKWPEVFATSDQNSDMVARILTEEIICRHSAPRQLLSDRGANFLSKLVQEICRMCDTRKINTTAYHPQTDGLVERSNRTLMDILSKMVSENQRDWDRHLPFCLFSYRTATQASTKLSPFQLLFGRQPRLPIDSELLVAIRPYCELEDYSVDAARRFHFNQQLARENIQIAQQNQAHTYNKTQNNIVFKPGDQVLLFNPQLGKGKTKKLAHFWTGPFTVKSTRDRNVFIQKTGHSASRLLRVHANRLKKYTTSTEQLTNFENADSDGSDEL